jgi:hypothetical protein
MAITHDFTTIHSCDSVTGITVIGDGAISVNTQLYKEGTGALNVYKPNTTTTLFGIEIPITATDFRLKLFSFWLYIKSSALPKISNIRLVFYDVSGNYGYRDVSPSILNPDGWKSILYMIPYRYQGGFYLTDPPFGDLNYRTSTYPDVTKIVNIRIEFYTNSPSDTISEGELIIDWIKLGRSIIVLEGIVGNLFTRIAQYDKQNNLGVIDYVNGNVLIKGAQIVIGDGVASYTCSSLGESVGIVTPQEFIAYVYVRKYSKVVIGTQVSGKIGKNGSVFNLYGYPYYNYVFQGEDPNASYLEVWQGSFNYYNIRGYPNGSFISNINAKLYNVTFYNAYTGALYRASYDLYNVVTVGSQDGIWGGTCLGLEEYKSFGDTDPIAFEYGQIATVSKIIARGNTYLARLNSFSGNVTLVDVITDSFNRIWTGTASSNTGTLKLAFTFSPRLIDVMGNPLSGVRIILKDAFGNIVYDNTTDINGRAPAQTIVVIKWVGKAQTGVNADTETNYNPFTLEVFKDNYKVYSAKITILLSMTQDITIPFSFTSTCYTNKASYSLNENVIVTAEFRDLSGLGVTGLSVDAIITKPDGTKETITLNDVGNGVYTGAYTNTGQVGTYYVEITTTIYGNTVKARASFDVGIIEKRIDEAKTEIISEVDEKAEEIKTHISESKPGAVFTLGT